ncbi:MAG: hypothetical protein V4662_12185 [Verrucomicrobiota bacterium]
MKSKFTFSGFSFELAWLTPELIVAGWVIYLLIYWRCLFQILSATRFEPNEKILWFLVITLVPVMGILTYWMLVSEKQRNLSLTEGHRQMNRRNLEGHSAPQS